MMRQAAAMGWRPRTDIARFLVCIGVVAGLSACHGTSALNPQPPESQAAIESSFVAEYQDHQSHSGTGFGVFDRRSGALRFPLTLPDVGRSAFGGIFEGADGVLLYAASDPGPQNGTAQGPQTGCHGDLYELDRRSGRITRLVHDDDASISSPVEGPQPGDYSFTTQNCPETSEQIDVVARGRRLALPAAVGPDSIPLDWTARGLLIWTASSAASAAIRLYAISDSGQLVSSSTLPITSGTCRVTVAELDALGVLEQQNCGRTTWFVQLHGATRRVRWRTPEPLCRSDDEISIDGRSVIMDGARPGKCSEGSINNVVEVGRITDTGLELREVSVNRRFVTSASM